MNSDLYTRPDKPKIIAVNRRADMPAIEPCSIPEVVAVDQSSECFVTPPPVIELMIDYAGIEPHHIGFDPNGGTGSICTALAEWCAQVKAYELNYQLADILKDKGFLIEQIDFLTVAPCALADRILMNPPFKNLAYIDHIRHAFKFLREGGRLLAVLPPLNSRNKCKLFAEWVEEIGGEFIALPPGSFENSGTLVNSQLLLLDN